MIAPVCQIQTSYLRYFELVTPAFDHRDQAVMSHTKLQPPLYTSFNLVAVRRSGESFGV